MRSWSIITIRWDLHFQPELRNLLAHTNEWIFPATACLNSRDLGISGMLSAVYGHFPFIRADRGERES